MDEAKKLVEMLRAGAEVVARCSVINHELVDKAVDTIERLAAEVERLRPRGMTLEEACKILDENRYLKSKWYVRENARRQKVASAFSEYISLMPFEAVAVAEKLLREKEADRG